MDNVVKSSNIFKNQSYTSSEETTVSAKKPMSEVENTARDRKYFLDEEVRSELLAMSIWPYENGVVRFRRPVSSSSSCDTKKAIKRPGPVVGVENIPKKNKTTNISSEIKELLEIMKQRATTIEEKYKILDARDKLLRIMQKENNTHKGFTVGTCPDMCPEKERLLRVIQHQVASYEQNSNKEMDPGLAVKQYSRSSADQESPLPHELRPVKTLQGTMLYLIHRIMQLGDMNQFNVGEWYHFLWDRTRSIRKDITQQALCCQGSVKLLEQCARFHIHCSGRLVAEDPSVFDQKINTENLTKCLQTLKYMYNDLRLKNEKCPNEAEFRAYIILLNLNDANFMWEVQRLPQEIQESEEVKEAIEFYLALEQDNFVRFFKLVRETSYLNACILMRYFMQVRCRGIAVILKSHTPRIMRGAYPLDDLTNNFGFENKAQTIEFLHNCGLKLNESKTGVILDKSGSHLENINFNTMNRSIKLVESKKGNLSIAMIVYGDIVPTLIHRDPKSSFDEHGYLMEQISFEEDADQQPENNEEITETIEPAIDTSAQRGLEEGAAAYPPYPQSCSYTEDNSSASAKVEELPLNQRTVLNTSVEDEMFGRSVPPYDDPEENDSIQVDEVRRTIEMLSRKPLYPLEVPHGYTVDTSSEASEYLRYDTESEDDSSEDGESDSEDEESDSEDGESDSEDEKVENKEMQCKDEEIECNGEKPDSEDEESGREDEESGREDDSSDSEDEDTDSEEETGSEDGEIESEIQELDHDRYRHECRQSDVEALVRWMADKVVMHEEEERKEQMEAEKSRRQTSAKSLTIPRRRNLGEGAAAYGMTSSYQNAHSSKTVEEEYIELTDNFNGKKYAKYLVERYSSFKLPEFLTPNVNKPIYWKCVVSTPSEYENPIDRIILQQTLQHFFQWEYDGRSLLQQKFWRNVPVRISIEKQMGGGDKENDANGIIFIDRAMTQSLCTRIMEKFENTGVHDSIPIVIILQDEPESNQDFTNFDTLVQQGIISAYQVLYENRDGRLIKLVEKALDLLAWNVSPPPPIQVEVLEAVLFRKVLCSETWETATCYAKTNPDYKACLHDPNVVFGIYNDGLKQLLNILLDDTCYEYGKFPKEFKQFESSIMFPSDYQLLPNRDGLNQYKQNMEYVFQYVMPLQYLYNWPPRDEYHLSEIIHTFCEYNFPESKDSVAHNLLDALWKKCDGVFARLGDVLWTDMMGVLMQQKYKQFLQRVSNLEYYEEWRFYGRPLVVYHLEAMETFMKSEWFYLTNPCVQSFMARSVVDNDSLRQIFQTANSQADTQETINRATQALSTDAYNYDVDLDMDALSAELDDLARSMLTTRRITSRFEERYKKCSV